MTTTKSKTSSPLVQLGRSGPKVFPLALGCMGMSGMYGASDDNESVATIQAAVERGVTLIDTGDFYGMGHNELLVGRALAGRRDKVQLSVKFGSLRGPSGAWLGADTRPAAVSTFVAYSLKRLNVEVIDIYRPSRLDPNVPIEDTVGAIADLIKAGYVRHIGLSEVGVDTIRRAQAVHPIVDLQTEYTLISREPEQKIFPALEELGISATLYGVPSRGLLSGKRPTDPKDFRANLPRFKGAAREQNDKLIAALGDFARARGLTPGQVAISYVLGRQPNFVPVIGARTRAQLDDAFGALTHRLTAAELTELERLVPASAVQGTRYAPSLMAHLDSER